MFANPPITADQARFLSAMKEWAGRTPDDFPTDRPPCGGSGSSDEDAILAKVLAEVASTSPFYAPSHALAVVTAAIAVHQRRIDVAWDAARASGPGVVADRTAWKEIKPYEAMVAVLHSWLGALWAASVEGAAA